MPTFEQNFQATIQARVTGRCYAVAAPPEPVAPFIVIQNVAAVPITDMVDGKGVQIQTRVQVDIWDPDYYNAHATAELVAADLAATGLFKTIRLGAAMDFGYEDETQLYRVMTEFSCWHT